MGTEVSTDLSINKQKRNIVIRILAAIFWLVLTMLIVNIIVSGVIGGMAGSEVGAGKTLSDAMSAGGSAGEQAAVQFMNTHGAKVFLFNLGLWLVLLLTGKYPWVSKFKPEKV